MILALDLGSNTGYALHGTALNMVLGSIPLATAGQLKADKKIRGDRRVDCRCAALHNWLGATLRAWKPSVVVFEDVRFARSQAQAHLWASFRGIVWSCCLQHGVPRVDCLDTGKLKIFATGNGHADKEQIRQTLLTKEQDQFTEAPHGYVRHKLSGNLLDDNAIDAYYLLRWAQSVYKP